MGWRATDKTLLTSGYGMFLGCWCRVSGPVSRCFARFGCFGVVRVWGPGWAGPRRRRGAGGDRGPAFGAGHLFQREGFELGGQCAQPPGVGEPGGVGAVLGLGEPAGDGFAFDGAGPSDVGAAQDGWVGGAGAAGLAAAGAADDDAAGQAKTGL